MSLPVLQLFVEYYQKQKVVPDGQWEDFMSMLKTPLPTTFRINGTGKFATDLRDKFESDFLANFNKDPIMVRQGLSLQFEYMHFLSELHMSVMHGHYGCFVS